MTLQELIETKGLDGTEKILGLGTDRRFVCKDGTEIKLSELSTKDYWTYMSMREHSWYKA